MYRLASEYQNTMASATGDRTRQIQLSREAAKMNVNDAITTKIKASRTLIAPRGSSRPAVRGLSASMRASTRRLNPIAALRAETMATRIQAIVVQPTETWRDARSAPASAKGSAKTVWLKRTNDRYTERRLSIFD